ncbi:hypothetical protein KSS87_020752 [Heliosperma pusillum]|nr:hypothetical protein KSS87_020752 [Heliosperma pusillum]
MDEMYGLHNHNHHPTTAAEYSEKALMTPENLILPTDYHALMMNSAVRFGSDELISATMSDSAASATVITADDRNSAAVIKAKIASHPYYPRLLRSYIDCHKVGAPPEIARLFEEIGRESHVCRQEVGVRTCIGEDLELDEFMETYCEILDKYKVDLSRPFDEATTFLGDIESQLRDLCKGAFVRSSSGG